MILHYTQMIVIQVGKQKMDHEIKISDIWHKAQCSSRPKVSIWGVMFVLKSVANVKIGEEKHGEG